MTDKIRVAIIDHYPIFRQGVVQAIGRAKNIALVAEGATAEDAEHFAREDKLDVLLLEASVPGSLRAAKAILQAHPSAKVVFLAASEDDQHANDALHAGVHGYIMKGITGPELVKTIKSVHDGERYITPELAWRLATQNKVAASIKCEANEPQLFGVREEQVLDHTFKGSTNAEIALILGISISTVKRYKTQIFRKIGAHNRLQAIVTLGSNRTKPKST